MFFDVSLRRPVKTSLSDWRGSLQSFHVVWGERAWSVLSDSLSGQLVLHHLYLLFISLITHMIAAWCCGYIGFAPRGQSGFLRDNQLELEKGSRFQRIWDCLIWLFVCCGIESDDSFSANCVFHPMFSADQNKWQSHNPFWHIKTKRRSLPNAHPPRVIVIYQLKLPALNSLIISLIWLHNDSRTKANSLLFKTTGDAISW